MTWGMTAVAGATIVGSMLNKGGGGGGGSAGGGGAPAQQNITQTTIPDYAKPYAESMLGQTAALTDINKNPFTAYQGQRVAGFTPMQAQAFQNVSNQQVAGQIGEASNMASQVGNTAMGAFGQGQQLGQAGLGYGAQASQAGNQYNMMATNPGAQQAFMSPYIQNALQPQLEEMRRQYGISGAQQQGAATRAGAFGGNREALMRSENNRNMGTAMNQAIGTGYQNAFDKAQQAQQFGANLGLQGLQTGITGVNTGIQAGQYGLQGLAQAGQAASTLGALGQTQFQQESGINQAMANAGAQQQALQQQGLNNQYQQYLDQLNYPYKQLAFQSDMLRGLPLSQGSSSVYTAAPSQLSQAAGIGLTGASMYNLMKKEGGVIKEPRGKGLAALELHRLVGNK
jgi:hypothetical protein